MLSDSGQSGFLPVRAVSSLCASVFLPFLVKFMYSILPGMNNDQLMPFEVSCLFVEPQSLTESWPIKNLCLG